MAERVEVDINELFRCSVRGLVAHPVIVLNGYYHTDNDVCELPTGVLCCSMAEARERYPQLLNKSEFAQLSPVDGVFIYVPAGIEMERPIQIINLLYGSQPSKESQLSKTSPAKATSPKGAQPLTPLQHLSAEQRNYIVVGKGAKVSLLVCDHTITGEPTPKAPNSDAAPAATVSANHGTTSENLTATEYSETPIAAKEDPQTPRRTAYFQLNNMTEVVVEEGAKVDYIEIESQSGETSYDNTINFALEGDASLTTMMLSLYGGEIRNNQKILFGGEGASCNLFGCYIAGEEQKIDNFTYVDHAVPRCTSNELFKGAMDGRSNGNFLGCIRVRRDAQKTEAYQGNNNLLLSDTARVNTKPQLIIDADDVKCSHGATIGRIDEEAMFYLRSRGIGEEEARMMMKSAFIYDIIRRIPLELLRNKVASMVEKRLRGGRDFCENCKIACKK